jgi:hypothetical protein
MCGHQGTFACLVSGCCPFQNTALEFSQEFEGTAWAAHHGYSVLPSIPAALLLAADSQAPAAECENFVNDM